VVHRGQQMDPPAVLPGAPQRLAVDRDSTPTLMLVGTVPVGKPRADHRRQQGRVEAAQGPADRGLGRDHPVVGGLAADAERGTDRLRGVVDPLGDRGHRPGAGKDHGGGHGQDRDQRVATAAAGSRVTDRGEIGQQVRRVGWPERVGAGVGEFSKAGWDRG